jgi:hypothetical protein
MVQQDVIDYIRVGKERGYSVNLLKSKLLENGFTMAEVNEAVEVVEKQMAEKDKPSVPSGIDYFKKEDKPFEKKPEEKKPVVKISGDGGNKGLKISAFSGFILLGLIVVLGIVGLVMGLFDGFGVDTLASGLGSFNISLMLSILFLLLVIGLLGLFHFLGYIKLGGVSNSKGLKVTGWAVLISGIVTILAGIVIVMLIYFQVSGIQASEGSLDEILNLASKVVAYMSIIMILSCIFSIFVVIFSIFLMKMRDVRFAFIAGILFLLFGLMALFGSGVLGYIMLYPGSLLMGNLTGGVASILSVVLSLYYIIVEFVFVLAGLVFGSLALLDASKNSRKL